MPSGALLSVGQLRVSDPDRAAGGRRRGEFRYAPSLARAFGLSAARAAAIREEVVTAAAQWLRFCDQAGVPSTHSRHFWRDIERRLAP